MKVRVRRVGETFPQLSEQERPGLWKPRKEGGLLLVPVKDASRICSFTYLFGSHWNNLVARSLVLGWPLGLLHRRLDTWHSHCLIDSRPTGSQSGKMCMQCQTPGGRRPAARQKSPIQGSHPRHKNNSWGRYMAEEYLDLWWRVWLQPRSRLHWRCSSPNCQTAGSKNMADFLLPQRGILKW